MGYPGWPVSVTSKVQIQLPALFLHFPLSLKSLHNVNCLIRHKCHENDLQKGTAPEVLAGQEDMMPPQMEVKQILVETRMVISAGCLSIQDFYAKARNLNNHRPDCSET